MAFAEQFESHSDDILSSFSLSEQIHTITDVIDSPFKTRRLAESQGLGQYSDETLHVHYVNNKRNTNSFMTCCMGKNNFRAASATGNL